MSQRRAAILGVHGYVPDYKLTNQELESMVETNDEWIRTRTGIEERRILKGEGLGSMHMAEQAVRGLLDKSGITADQIGLTICATATSDFIFPDNATMLNKAIGATNAFGFDLSAACSGFLYAITTGATMIEAGRHDYVLVIGADKMSAIVDYQDRATCIIFGDGAGAVLLGPDTSGNGLIDSHLRGDGSGYVNLHMKAGGSRYPATAETLAAREHYAFQDGRPVFKAAVSRMAESVGLVMEKNGLTADDVHWVVPHQANLRIINSVASMADIPMDKVMVNIQKYGNTTAATIPLCLWEYEEQLAAGQNIILTAFGGGYTWGAVYLKWAYNP